MTKVFLYLNEIAYTDAWTKGGTVPISLASRYLATDRDGVMTPDEALVHESLADLVELRKQGIFLQASAKDRPAGNFSTKGLIVNGELIPEIEDPILYREDGLVLCFSMRRSSDLAKRLGNKRACVEIADIEALKHALDQQLGIVGVGRLCDYTADHQRGHFLKSVDDSWQEEYRLFWRADEPREVTIPPSTGAVVSLYNYSDEQVSKLPVSPKNGRATTGDPFDEPRRHIAQAGHRGHLLHIAEATFLEDAFIRFVDQDPESGLFVHKSILVKPLPPLIRNDYLFIFRQLRLALDKLATAVNVASGRDANVDIEFPFANSESEFEELIGRTADNLAPEVIDLFRTAKPYLGGDEDLWALSKVPIDGEFSVVSGFVSRVDDHIRRRQSAKGPFEFVGAWSEESQELTIFRAGSPQKVRTGIGIAIGDVGKFRGLRAFAVFEHVGRKVEKLIEATAARVQGPKATMPPARRLGRPSTSTKPPGEL